MLTIYIYIYIYYNIYIYLVQMEDFLTLLLVWVEEPTRFKPVHTGLSENRLPGKPTKHVARCLRPSSAHWKVGTVRRVLGCLALVEEFGVFRAIKYSLFRLGDLSESSAGQL